MQHSATENTPPQPGYLPLREAAKWAGVSPRTIKRWVKRGLPTYQAGSKNKVLIRSEDIDKFLTRKLIPKPDLEAIVDEVLNEIFPVRSKEG